jgi:hypothetical protein
MIEVLGSSSATTPSRFRTFCRAIELELQTLPLFARTAIA